MIIGGVPEAEGRAEAHWIGRPGTAANDTVAAITIAVHAEPSVGAPL